MALYECHCITVNNTCSIHYYLDDCLFILAYNHVHGKVCNQTIIIPMNLIICSLMGGGV